MASGVMAQEAIRCPHCEAVVRLPWAEINRKAVLRDCPKCKQGYLVKAQLLIPAVLRVRNPKPGELNAEP